MVKVNSDRTIETASEVSVWTVDPGDIQGPISTGRVRERLELCRLDLNIKERELVEFATTAVSEILPKLNGDPCLQLAYPGGGWQFGVSLWRDPEKRAKRRERDAKSRYESGRKQEDAYQEFLCRRIHDERRRLAKERHKERIDLAVRELLAGSEPPDLEEMRKKFRIIRSRIRRASKGALRHISSISGSARRMSRLILPSGKKTREYF